MAATAATGLRDQGIASYNPQYSQRSRFGWQRVQLFANYLFLAGVSGRERAINGTKGILRILPGLLPVGFISGLQASENSHGVVVLPSRPKFADGSPVAFGRMSLPAVYLGQTSRDRAMILMSMLGRDKRLEVSEADLVAA